VQPLVAAFGLVCGIIKRTGAITESLLIITGSMGSGKTSALGEASDLLALRHIIHAAIDLDALGLAHIDSGETKTVMYRNLQCVCKNYAALNVKRLLLARAIEDRAELELCRAVVSATNTVVCRLIASIETMKQRVRMRESGGAQQQYLARVEELNAILDRARLEDFIVNSTNRSVTEVAEEMLIKALWISK
jgi:adenylylsulfate kinase